MNSQWNDKIFSTQKTSFEPLVLDIFRFQYENNPVYKDYITALSVDVSKIERIEQIPFLPIQFFKTHAIKTPDFEPAIVFESSGTTGSINSKHFIKDVLLYEKIFINGFEFFYGHINEWCILGLLPSYLERKNSSLVYMVDKLIERSEHPQSNFYLYEYEKLFSVLNELEKRKQKTLLIGVTFALLEFAEKFSLSLNYTTIMETGGMKGRRQELVREEVHNILKNSFHVSSIHSEYGMTELLSQAYSKGNGIFHCTPWMKVLIRDEEDPLRVYSHELIVGSRAGAVNIIDLANIYSCSFIATDDLGKIYPDGSFEVLGRIDNSDLRGCSLLYMSNP